MENNLKNIFELIENSLIHESINKNSSPLNKSLISEINNLLDLEDENKTLNKLEILNDILLDDSLSDEFKRELSINGLKSVFNLNDKGFSVEKNNNLTDILGNNLQVSDSLFSSLIDNLIYFENDSLNVDLDLLTLMAVKKVSEQSNSDLMVREKHLISSINSLGDYDIDFCFFLLKDDIIENLKRNHSEDEVYNFTSNIEDYLEPNQDEFENLLDSIPKINILNGKKEDKNLFSLNEGLIINSNTDILELLRNDDFLKKLEETGLKVFTPVDKMNYDLNSNEELLFDTSPATYSIGEIEESGKFNEISRYSPLTNSISPISEDELEKTLKIVNNMNLSDIRFDYNGTEVNSVINLRHTLFLMSKNDIVFDSINVDKNIEFVLNEYNQSKQDHKKKVNFKK